MGQKPEEKYRVEFAASAAREFRDLSDDVKRRVRPAVDDLERKPRPTGCRKLHGHQHLYRLRVGAYRVIYEISDKEKAVRVTRIRHRRDVYK